MIAFYLDEAMTRRVTTSAPKRFLAPTTGYVKHSTVYLGDPYSTTLSANATSGASVITLADTSEFPTPGQATVGTQTISFTGVSGFTLTGVTGLTSNVSAGTIVTPLAQWDDTQPITIYPSGLDALSLLIALRLTGSSSFNFPGMPLILSQSSLALGNPLAIDIQISVPAVTSREYTNWTVSAGPFYQAPAGDASPGSGTVGMTAVLYGYVNVADQALPLPIRVLPINRQVVDSPPGFTIGEYCWRDNTEINEQTVIPTNWNTDPTTMDSNMFIAGIGAGTDLQPLGFTQIDNSIYLQINRGYYFTGAKSYYLPATPELDSQSALSTIFSPINTPVPTLPIFIGNYILDSQGFYEWNDVYRYETSVSINRHYTLDTPLPEYYYTWDPVLGRFTLNLPLPIEILNLGPISGAATDYYNIPIYPIEQINSMYVLKPDGTHLNISSWAYNGDAGTVTLTNNIGTGPSVSGSVQGESVVAICTPGVAVLFDTTTNPVRTLDTIDLNPAFAGISGGIVYLQHSRQSPASVVLACDKPIIQIPATYSSIIGLVAYGPVYFNGDYALLQATAYDAAGEIIQGASLEVIADSSTFTGTINYEDPTTTTIVVKTGSDGIANMIFRPASNYGFWIPTTAPSGSLAGIGMTYMADDTLVLPESVPISQLYDSSATQPFLVNAYTVLNNNPVLGMVGANIAKGQVAFTTSGTPGTPSYKTNGEIDIFLNSSEILYPIQMLDSGGNNYTSGSFNGNVIRLVYAQSFPNDSLIGAYFVTFTQRTLLRMQVVNSNVESNSILLQMQVPPPIDDDIWLILNDQFNGILNQYRLGWTSLA